MIAWFKRKLYAAISERYMHGCSNYNDLEVRRSCRSKAQGRDKFAEGGVPHAHGLVFFNPWRAHQFASEHGFPLVIKPNVSGYSRGSYFPITNFKELWRAMLLARIWWPMTVVEQYLAGPNYRVVTVKGKIMSVIQRYPPFVIGNGRDTISTLIDNENAERERLQLLDGMFPISKGELVRKHLKKNGYTLDSVPRDAERVECFHRVALAPGGVVHAIETEAVHPDNVELFLHVLDLFKANLLGIDVIFERGIDESYKSQSCIVLEVNSRPYLKMHHYPRYGKKHDLSAYYAELDQLAVSQPHTF